MLQEELIKKYNKDVEYLRKCAKNLNLSDSEIDEIFASCIKIIKLRKNRSTCTNQIIKRAQKCVLNAVKIFIFLLFSLLAIYVLLNVHQPTSSIVLRNVQGLIHPGLKVLRFVAVPIIKAFPSLTNLYDESCLVENPFFYVTDMECWPCENVHSVMDLTGFNNHSLYQSGIPYIIKTDQKEVTYEMLLKLYKNNMNIMNNDADNIKSNNPHLLHIWDLLDISLNESSTTHIAWRINRMVPGQAIRTLFHRPFIVSEWSGQSIERYIMMDGSQAEPYVLPNTECSYIFVVQGAGERTVILRPSRECVNHCKTVSVLLKPSHVLWYNWWYWRPLSLPVANATEPSVTYISSYC